MFAAPARPALRATLLPMAALLAIILLPAVPAQAEAPLTAEEFDAYTAGKTLSYGMGGTVYGIEQYLSGRRVRWAFREGECTDGSWYQQDQHICFVYEQDGTPQCWLFFRGEGGLRAQFASDGPGSELTEVAQMDGPLSCPGPDVGV